VTYVIYNTETGEILRVLSGTQKTLEQNLEVGEGYLESDEDPAGKRVVGGAVVPLPSEELEAAEIEKAWNKLRVARDKHLSKSDWTQFPDSPADTGVWAEYRQKLRDLPSTVTDPRDVEWPEEPQ
jgi:hypothetical protein